jgi:4-amino-4-deoxy-L-arabinose transferase-like glycosyltransferase
MAAPGGDWLVPHLNGAVYHDKPPLLFWIAASAQRPFARSDAFQLARFCGDFLLLSVFPVKRHHYLMPLHPGAALLAVQAASHSRRAAGRALIALAATLVQARVIEAILGPGREKPAFLLVDRENLDRKGTPAGVQRLVEWPRALAPDLVLLGSNEE